MATKPVQKQEFKNKEERLKALKSKSASINKTLGLTGLTRASDLNPYRRASFGVPELDAATGGGLIHGAFTTIWGGKGAGKTTLALRAVAQAQKEGKICYWIALENFDPQRALWAGVDLDELTVGQFPQAEMCLDTIIAYARNKLVDVIVLDSIHSMSPKGEQENSKGDKSIAENTMGLLARKLSTFFPQAIDPIKRAEIACLLIGQTRMKIGIISLEHLSGGNALLHNSRLILKQSRGAQDDAPVRTTYEPSGEKDGEGNLILGKDGQPKQKAIKTIIGFPANFRFDAVQVSNCKPEKTLISIPYYFESGFDLPQFIKEENEAVAKVIGAPTDAACGLLHPIPTIVDKITEPKTKATVEKTTEPTVKVRKRGRSAKAKKV